MARPRQTTRHLDAIEEKHDARSNDSNDPAEPKKSDEMRKADVSDGESP